MAEILVICTGNVCRSPIAEGMLRAALERRFGDRSPTVTSAGTSGWDGSGAMAESVTAAAERGVDISGHRARRLTRGDVADADLVVAMAAEHRDAVQHAVPDAAGRTYTLKELVRLLEALPPADPTAGSRLFDERLERADALRSSGFDGNPNDDDVVDPLGLPLESYRAIAWELDEWTRRLSDGLFGAVAAARAEQER